MPRDVDMFVEDINALQEGLKLLAAADAAVDTMVQEDGQHVIAVAGELHLEVHWTPLCVFVSLSQVLFRDCS